MSAAEQAEIRGLLGRVIQAALCEYGGNRHRSLRKRELLMRSVEEYAGMYDSSRGKHTWHGINVVALLARAERDDFGIRAFVTASCSTQILRHSLARRCWLSATLASMHSP